MTQRKVGISFLGSLSEIILFQDKQVGSSTSLTKFGAKQVRRLLSEGSVTGDEGGSSDWSQNAR